MKSKRTWNAPTLIVHGKVETVTKEDFCGDKDVGGKDCWANLSVLR